MRCHSAPTRQSPVRVVSAVTRALCPATAASIRTSIPVRRSVDLTTPSTTCCIGGAARPGRMVRAAFHPPRLPLPTEPVCPMVTRKFDRAASTRPSMPESRIVPEVRSRRTLAEPAMATGVAAAPGGAVRPPKVSVSLAALRTQRAFCSSPASASRCENSVSRRPAASVRRVDVSATWSFGIRTPAAKSETEWLLDAAVSTCRRRPPVPDGCV